MTKTLASVFGIVYVLLGIVGFFNTPLVGTDGFFASNAFYNFVLVAIGAVLLFGAFYAQQQTRTISMIVGAVLVLFALSGFTIVPERGEMLGMLVSGSVHWLNLIMGALLLGAGLVERGVVEQRRHATV